MAKKRISDVLIEVLANAGIERIYGITGDSLNSVNDSLRRNGKIAFEHVRHEETAAFAAGAEASRAVARGRGGAAAGPAARLLQLWPAHAAFARIGVVRQAHPRRAV